MTMGRPKRVRNDACPEGKILCSRCRVAKDPSKYEIKEDGTLLKTCFLCRSRRQRQRSYRSEEVKDAGQAKMMGNDPKYLTLLRRPWSSLADSP